MMNENKRKKKINCNKVMHKISTDIPLKMGVTIIDKRLPRLIAK